MKITERFRQLTQISGDLVNIFVSQPDGVRIDRAVSLLKKSQAELVEWDEQVGEIPQMRLEQKLSPVLLQVHETLDRARVLYEDAGKTDEGALIWDLEQRVYRLLNDL